MFLAFDILVAWPLSGFNLELSKKKKKINIAVNKPKRYVVKEKSFLLTFLFFSKTKVSFFIETINGFKLFKSFSLCQLEYCIDTHQSHFASVLNILWKLLKSIYAN